ncbi:MAG: hypothetical protein AAFY26_05430 [Cyanobacteria bacterium J06638_22]
MNVATTALSLVIATTAFAPVAEATEMTKTELSPFQTFVSSVDNQLESLVDRGN